MSLAKKLVSLRKQKGLTQMDLADRLNVSRQAISRWEVGAAVPSTENLKVLSELYGVQVDFLLNDDAECESKTPEFPEKAVVLVDEGKRSRRKSVIIGILVIVITIATLVCVARLHDRETETVMPIVDMDIDTADDGPDGTFNFD